VRDVLAVDPPVPRERDLARDVHAAGGEVGEVLLAAVVGVHGLRGDRTGGRVRVERRDGLRRGGCVGVVGVGLLLQGEGGDDAAAWRRKGEGAVDGVGEEDGVRRDVGGEGERGERVEHVAGGDGVGLGPRDVRVESERSEVRGGGVVGSEGEEERLVVRDHVGHGLEREEEEHREGGAEDGEHGGEEAEEAAARVGLCQRRPGGEERGRVEAGHGAGSGGWCALL